MTKTRTSPHNATGFTLVELMIVVMILGVIASIVVANYETLTAKARYSRIKADMNGIAYAGYIDYTNSLGVWPFQEDPAHPLDPPASLLAAGGYTRWPQPPCPGWYYTWDNGPLFGVDVVRVSLRNVDDAAVFSYCVNSFGGGSCQAEDLFSGVTGHAPPVEVSTSKINHLSCSE